MNATLDSIKRTVVATATPAPLAVDKLVKHNFGAHKVEMVTTGVSSTVLIGGVIAASVLGGPIGLIAGLAAAAFITLAILAKRALTQPKQDPNLKTFTTNVRSNIATKISNAWTSVKNTLSSAGTKGKNFVQAHGKKIAGAAALTGLAAGGYVAYSAATAPAMSTALTAAIGTPAQTFAQCAAVAAPAAMKVPASIIADTAAKATSLCQSNLGMGITAPTGLCQLEVREDMNSFVYDNFITPMMSRISYAATTVSSGLSSLFSATVSALAGLLPTKGPKVLELGAPSDLINNVTPLLQNATIAAAAPVGSDTNHLRLNAEHAFKLLQKNHNLRH